MTTQKLTPSTTAFDDLPDVANVSARTLAQVLAVSEVTIWRWSKDSRLPKPRKLGANTTRWNVGEVRAALAKLAA